MPNEVKWPKHPPIKETQHRKCTLAHNIKRKDPHTPNPATTRKNNTHQRPRYGGGGTPRTKATKLHTPRRGNMRT